MTDAAARLAEALDRAEQAARACTEGPWWAEETDEVWQLHGVAFRIPPQGFIPEQVVSSQIIKAPKKSREYAEYWPGEADTEHIVAWNPVAILRLIARDRALLAARASADRNVSDHVAACGPDLCGCRDYLAATATLQVLTTAVDVAAAFWLPEVTGA